MSPLVSCPKCRTHLLEGMFNQPDLAPCPSCGVPLHVEVFPALFRPIRLGETAQAVLVEGESSCFFHPQKKAVRPCDGCGRFLCALCDCELHDRHFCPACLEAGRSKGKIQNLENQRMRYDNVALSLAILPVLAYYLTFITAPMALYVAIRYWKAPRSLVTRSSTRFFIAIGIALLQVGAWITLVTVLIAHKT